MPPSVRPSTSRALLSACTTICGRLFCIALLIGLGLLNVWLPLLGYKKEIKGNSYNEYEYFSLLRWYLYANTSTSMNNVYVQGNGCVHPRAGMLPDIFCHLSPSFFAISVVASSGLLLLIFCNGKVPVNIQHIPQVSV
jgi:hypothetical protein